MRARVSFFSSSSEKEEKRRPKCQSAVCRILSATSSCASRGVIREQTPCPECELFLVLCTGVNEFARAIFRIQGHYGPGAWQSRLPTHRFLPERYELEHRLGFEFPILVPL